MSKVIRNTLERARKYQETKLKEIGKEQRPVYHLSSPVGWINDPNGFSEFQGEYHLFYQYHPYSKLWGPMHWGHSKTKDFIKWEQMPVALAPEHWYDAEGCFSGSAIEYDGKHILMYTSVEEADLGNGKKVIRQRQAIAIGDGVDYKKVEKNPVLSADLLPEGSSHIDFRDPKIWREDGKFYCVVGNRNEDMSGQIVLFSSDNMIDWEFEMMLDQCKNEYGSMWECPDFFPLEEKHVLIISPQNMKAKNLEFHNGNNSIYILGTYNKQEKQWKRESIKAIDYGLDFYAPQTMETSDGRRIMIGWMQSWDNYMTPDDLQWSGMMTIPREITLRDGVLYQNPVKELEQYRKNLVAIDSIIIDNEEKKFENIKGRVIELEVHIKESEYDEFVIQVAKKDGYYTEIRYEANRKLLTFDRSYSGVDRDVICTRSAYLDNKNGEITLKIFVDRYSVECFANDGVLAMTNIIYSDISADDISFICKGKAIFDVKKYDIVV